MDRVRNNPISKQPLRFIPEMRAIFPLKCSRIPMTLHTFDIGKPITIISRSTGIFDCIVWSGQTSHSASLELSFRSSNLEGLDGIKEVAGFASWDVILALYAAEKHIGPKVLSFWLSHAIHIDTNMRPSSYQLLSIIYSKFDTTLDVYVREYIRAVAKQIVSPNDASVFIENLIFGLSGSMADVVKQSTIDKVYMIACDASDYVLYNDQTVGIPRKVGVRGWTTDRIITIGQFDTSSTPYRAQGTTAEIKNPGKISMLETLTARVKAGRFPPNQVMQHYAYQLFVMVLLNEIIDVMEIVRGELLTGVFHGDREGQQSLKSYDNFVDRETEVLEGLLADRTSPIEYVNNELV
ncbi:MAG: hypothetical protein P4L69_07105 [Desulfosporosinus sp.]|nr:hypothetical protein [Desulfosporosinus sp.]